MVKKVVLFLLSAFIIVACTPVAESQVSASVVTVYSTSAAQPWLTELFACADKNSVVLNITATDPEISLQIGEPENLIGSAFQIGEEELLVVTHRESSLQNLKLEDVQTLFLGQGDSSMQVWVYASDEDIQVLFEQVVMNGRSVSSSAKVAANPQIMSDLLNENPNAVGILPRHWKTGDVREIYSMGKMPVLAIVSGEMTETIRALLTCLSK